MSSEFQGATALITGASRGIGAATAVALAREGVSRLLLHYGSHREGAERTAEAACRAGAHCELLQAQLDCWEGVESFVEQLKQIQAPVDILINNAGHLIQRAGLLDFTPELYERVMTLNVKSAWFITQAVAPRMIERGGGVVVFLSSIAARNGGGPGATVYAAAKAAISAMTKGLAKELGPQGIRVNAVSPGTVDNDFHARYSTPEMLEAMRRSTVAGRLGTNEEVADLIVFLCSEKSRYIYGQTIEINGGLYMI
jgi:3-oxoacyl-[acyl-carrier protein] reductase